MSKTMVYIGPSMEGVVMTGTAFAGGYPAGAESFKQRAVYGRFICIGHGLAESRKHCVIRKAD